MQSSRYVVHQKGFPFTCYIQDIHGYIFSTYVFIHSLIYIHIALVLHIYGRFKGSDWGIPTRLVVIPHTSTNYLKMCWHKNQYLWTTARDHGLLCCVASKAASKSEMHASYITLHLWNIIVIYTCLSCALALCDNNDIPLVVCMI